GHTVVEVRGEVAVYPAGALRERLLATIEGGARSVVVDLNRVDFLDSTGLGVLVGALKRLKLAGGRLALVCDSEKLLKVFRITALDRVFTLHDSVEAATTATSPEGRCPQSAWRSRQRHSTYAGRDWSVWGWHAGRGWPTSCWTGSGWRSAMPAAGRSPGT